MKFVYFSSLFMACALSAGAQGIYQFADPGFENEWVEGTHSGYYEPGYGWHSFASATGTNWIVNMGLGMSPHPKRILKTENPDKVHSGDASVCLYSKDASITYANGNLTTGIVNMGGIIADDQSNYNFTKCGSNNCFEFAGTPDAVTFWAKFKPGTAKDDNTPLQGRGKFILHDECDYQDPETDADGNIKEVNKGHRVALAEQLITNQSWTEYTAEFKYDERTSAPTKQYLLASFTTNPIPGGSCDDELYIDDVYFVYYSDLKSLSYDGTPINIADPENIQIAAKNFDLSKVSCTSGKGADIQKNYDSATGILTITINGNDISVNSENHNTYRVKVVPPTPEEVTGTYHRWITVNMPTPISESANDIEITDEKDGEVSFGLNEFYLEAGTTNMGPIVVPNAKLSYTGDGSISIVAENQMVAIPGLGGIEMPITLTATMSADKKLVAALNIPFGSATVNVNVGEVPFATSDEENGILKVTGKIATASGAAYVKGESKANVIDLTGATLAKDLNSSNFSVEANNTLYKIADSQTLAGNNVIQNGTCKTLVLTDGLTFNAPEGFEAANVTFNRKFTTGNLSTVVLPFSFDAADVNGTVYKLESVENGVLSFKSVEGTTEANVPYLVKTEGDNLFKTETPKKVTVAPTPETVENSIAGTGVTHVGNFGETMEITSSDDQTSWYGYNKNGSFVKVLSGTVKPFRSAIKSTGAAPSSFALKLDGTVTGILNLENPNAKVDVYTVSGVCVRKNVPAASALNGLSRGVYIVGGQKVVK